MVSILTAAELAALRLDVAGMLPQTVTIQRATETVDDYGHAAKSFATVATVAGRVDPLAQMSGQSIVANQEEGRAYYRLSVEYDANLVDGDQVIVDSVTYQVKQLHQNNALPAVKRATIVRFG